MRKRMQRRKKSVKRVKKDETDIAPSARHVPATHLMLPPLRGGKLRGEPRDGGKVLFGYPGSWAHCISETIDHKDVARLFRHQSSFKKMEFWPLEGECARVRDLVENSGLYNVVVNYVIVYEKVAVFGFCERYHSEVDTFQLHFGEMAITPDDAEQILGLQVEGKSTCEKFKRRPSWETSIHGPRTCLAGIPRRLMGFSRRDLKKKEKEGGLSDMKCSYAAARYLLYVLASVIFPDSKGNRVSANLLQLLDPLEDVSKYSWGTAIIAHLNGQLSQGSRKLTSQISGNLTLIQVWIYDHFPSLIKDNEDVELNPKWSKGSPTGTKYLFTGSQDREQTDALIQMRQKLDNITAKEVVFNPYKNNRVGAMEDIVYYHGPLFHPNGFSMYNPIRIMRQLGFIQDSPDEDYVPPFKHKLEKCEADEAGIKVDYEPEVDVKHWNDRHSRLVDISWSVHADEGHEETQDYVEWYEGFSHGRVIWLDPTPGRRTNRASTSSSSQVDSRDATSILTLVRERMKLLVKAFCCSADKGEVMDPVKKRWYVDYCTHIENPNAKKMFKELDKEGKRSRKSRSQRAQEVAEHVQSSQHHDEHPGLGP
ncbi:protein MAINTENANCE OF MERISTEMS-like [Papaver somniferum]|uniref:protein MAINTENANCE OF MERISTEMS-like n=1 Tax=Papaver somniferum TaxID=3469 RepID=UPI000E6FEAF9|nr:protein MAINTENANCE OF MERISTEMS-like [Papaver somniferum]